MSSSGEWEAQELLDELDLGRPSRAPAPLIEVVRPLTEADLPVLVAVPNSLPLAPRERLQQVKYSHHQLARYVARGVKQVDISALTGYTPSYIGGLLEDPTFKELVAHYSGNEDLIHVEVLDRMRALHVASMEELQKRLDGEPEGWSKRELMDLADMMGKPTVAVAQGKAQAQGMLAGGGGVNIGITFVNPQDSQKSKSPTSLIDPEARDVESVDVSSG